MLLGSPITCSDTSVCVTDEFLGFAGCCDPEELESCRPATACLPFTKSTECGADCDSDTMTKKW